MWKLDDAVDITIFLWGISACLGARWPNGVGAHNNTDMCKLTKELRGSGVLAAYVQ